MMKLPINYEKASWRERKEAREAHIIQQRELCQFCKEPLDKGPALWVTDNPIDWSLFPKGFISRPVHLHHDHNTGMTIGAVHAYCNAYLWQYHGE